MREPKWVVKDVKANEDFTLDVEFADGSLKRYDASGLLAYPVFAPLKDVSFFKRAHVEFDTVVWNEDIDIAPEHLYEQGMEFPS